MRGQTTVRIAVLAAACISLAAAQSRQGSGFGNRLKKNAEALKHYSYKRRTAIMYKGKSRPSRVDLVRYVDGKMETVPLESPAPSQQSHRHGLRGKIAQKKIAKKKQEIENLHNLMEQYRSGGGAMQEILQKATITRLGSGPDAGIQISANGLKNPSDSFTMVWSVANRRPATVDIHAENNGKPVTIHIEYASLAEGLFYPAHTVIANSKKDMTITVDRYDYTPSGESAPAGAGQPH